MLHMALQRCPRCSLRRHAASLHPSPGDDLAMCRHLDTVRLHGKSFPIGGLNANSRITLVAGTTAATLYASLLPVKSAPPPAVAAAYGAFLLDVANEPALVRAGPRGLRNTPLIPSPCRRVDMSTPTQMARDRWPAPTHAELGARKRREAALAVRRRRRCTTKLQPRGRLFRGHKSHR